jgi:hypothetical protein
VGNTCVMSFPLRDSPEIPDSPASPVGRRFPTVTGTALSGESVRFPDDLFGAPSVLLVAYQRMAQVDVSSWLEFLAVREPELTVYEVPTIPAIAYRPWAGWIDNGMRKGVPRVLWPQVVTLYGEGVPVHRFLGDDGYVGASAVLLDAHGVVRWFDGRGFTPDKGGDLLDELRQIDQGQ